jgi:hypothetical protein
MKDGAGYYCEIGEFYALSVIDETPDVETGIFTYFNRHSEILYTGFVTAAPGFKDHKMTSKPSQKKSSALEQNEQSKRLLTEQFDQLAVQYAATVEAKALPAPAKSLQGKGEIVPLLKVEAKTRTQDEMRELCRLIRNRGQLGTSEYTEINLSKLVQVAHATNFDNISNMELTVQTLGDKAHNYSLQRKNGLAFVIIAGDTGKELLGFAIFDMGDGSERIIELEMFSLLTVHFKSNGVHKGLFTVFNREHNILSAEFCDAYPTGELSIPDVK